MNSFLSTAAEGGLANHNPRKAFNQYAAGLKKISSGIYELDYRYFQIQFVNLNELEVTGIDTGFLMELADTDKLIDFLESANNQNLVDRLKEFVYDRLRAFENEPLRRKYMPATYEADITDMVMPYYEKGIEKGQFEAKLEDARRMKDLGAEIDFIIKVTGLSREELKKYGIVK